MYNNALSPDSKGIQRKRALITGASSGIGKAYARYLASQGYDLIITGRRKALLYKTAQEIQDIYHVDVKTIIADLFCSEDTTELLNATSIGSPIDVLINNAGYSLNCAFTQDELSHQMDMIKVHINVPLMLIRNVLPGMMKNKRGIIINLSSLASSIPSAKSGMYSGTKSFIRTFTESLHMEVKSYGIRVQCLCPGFTHSDFHRSSHLKDTIKPFFWLTPEQVVNYSIYCLNKGKVICIPGIFYRIINFISKFIPRKIYYSIVYRLEKSVNPARAVNPAWNYQTLTRKLLLRSDKVAKVSRSPQDLSPRSKTPVAV